MVIYWRQINCCSWGTLYLQEQCNTFRWCDEHCPHGFLFTSHAFQSLFHPCFLANTSKPNSTKLPNHTDILPPTSQTYYHIIIACWVTFYDTGFLSGNFRESLWYTVPAICCGWTGIRIAVNKSANYVILEPWNPLLISLHVHIQHTHTHTCYHPTVDLIDSTQKHFEIYDVHSNFWTSWSISRKSGMNIMLVRHPKTVCDNNMGVT